MAEIGSAVAGEVRNSLFVMAKKEIGYMWNYSANIKELENGVKDLEEMKKKVEQRIESAQSEGDNLIVGVEKWVEKAVHEISKAKAFLEEEEKANTTCFTMQMCGNWATLHHYGKMATKMTPSLLEHQERGKDFVTCVSVYTPPPGPLDVYQTKHPEDLVTHRLALNKIMTALEDDNIQIIGIYGLGGVGKTTLAKEASKRIKKNNMLFTDDVAFITVTQTVNAEKIQKDLEKERKRIMKGDKILIILDDVWEKLNLEELCIPIDHKNCKILLTSRNEDVCEKMNVQSKIFVNPLPTKEAWLLFKRVVGERVETDADLKPVAEEVAKECGGLPLLIQVVGSALKNRSISSWNSALSRLKKPAPSEIDPDLKKAFNHLRLSYDYLESEEAKSCFLLCSMFPEDFNISLEDLVHYGVGLEKFDDLDSIEDARGRIQDAVNSLTSSSLLLNSQPDGCTKMHDVIRDVALLIASQGNNKFMVKARKGLTEWLPTDTSYVGISLMSNNINKLPDYEVHLPNLKLFVICFNNDLSMISDEFIQCIKNVRVLDISWSNISSLPQSFQLLTKLRMLDFRGNKSLHEISILGVLRDLEILILNETGINEIPKEIAQLEKLRVLQVTNCVDLSRITQGVISALWRLECLNIDLRWMSEDDNGCIAEVMRLSKLTYLDLKVKSFDLIPEGFHFKNLNGFVIQTGHSNPMIKKSRWSDRYLVISEHLLIPFVKWLKELIEVSRPNTILSEIENLNNIMPTLNDEGFIKLQHIELYDCPNVSCLVDDFISCNADEGKIEEKFFKELKTLKLGGLHKLEVLWKCPDEYISLTNLVTLYIRGCHKLKRVFIVSVAQGLVNLKKLDVKSCNDLEEVIWSNDNRDDEIGNIIVFPSLAHISLWDLRNIKSFYSGSENCSINYPSLVHLHYHDCESMKIWGPGIHETPKLKPDGPNAINDVVIKMHKHQADLRKLKLSNEEKEDDKE